MRGLALVLVAAVVLGAAGRAAWSASRQLAQRSDLVLESMQYASVDVLRRGGDLYAPSTYAAVPYTLTMYTPLYFLAVAALPQAPGRRFLTGRLVSLASVLGAAALLFAVPHRRRRALPWLALGCFLLYWPVTCYLAYLRCDTLALLLSAATVTLVRRRTPRAVALAGLCAALALAAKQSTLTPGLAALSWLALVDRPAARRFLAWGGGAALLGLCLAMALSGRGFLFSIVGATTTPLEPAGMAIPFAHMLDQPLFGVATLLCVLTAAAALRARGLGALRAGPELLYAALATALAILTLAKQGSADNYLLSPMLAQLFWLVAAFGDDRAPLPQGARAAALGAVLLAAGLELATTRAHAGRVSLALREPEAARTYHAALRAGLERAAGPDALVLSLGPARYSYVLSDRPCVNDPYLYHLLWSTGRLSERPLLRDVEARRFDAVVLRAVAAPGLDVGTPYGRLERAVRAHYRAVGTDAVHAYFVR